MKISYIDNKLYGHYYGYIKALAVSDAYESVMVLSKQVELPLNIKQYEYSKKKSDGIL